MFSWLGAGQDDAKKETNDPVSKSKTNLTLDVNQNNSIKDSEDATPVLRVVDEEEFLEEAFA